MLPGGTGCSACSAGQYSPVATTPCANVSLEVGTRGSPTNTCPDAFLCVCVSVFWRSVLQANTAPPGQRSARRALLANTHCSLVKARAPLVLPGTQPSAATSHALRYASTSASDLESRRHRETCTDRCRVCLPVTVLYYRSVQCLWWRVHELLGRSVRSDVGHEHVAVQRAVRRWPLRQRLGSDDVVVQRQLHSRVLLSKEHDVTDGQRVPPGPVQLARLGRVCQLQRGTVRQ